MDLRTSTTGTLLKMVASKKPDATPFVSRTFQIDDITEAHDVFSRAAETVH